MKVIRRMSLVGMFFGVIVAITAYFSLDLNSLWGKGLLIGGVIITMVSYILFFYNRLMRDRDFKKEIFDERYVMIKEKTGYLLLFILYFLLSVAVATFLILDYKVPAAIIAGILFIQPLLLVIISDRLDKVY